MFFDTCLHLALLTSYDPASYPDHSTWQSHLKGTDARIQWDPDHDMGGHPLPQKAIQIGLRRDLLRQYVQDATVEVKDMITTAVHEMRLLTDQGQDMSVMMPNERPYTVSPIG